jgi:hypothetical protein
MSLLKESQNTTAWYTSFTEMPQFKDQPTWFTTKLEYAEAVVSDKVVCDSCGWSWAVKDGTQDGETNPYLCHKCDYDNRPVKATKNNRKL